MCGIIGYIGNRKTQNVLINGLECLEYRGYDSSGIAVLNKNIIKVIKDEGRVSNLKALVEKEIFDSRIGIAHTRWATHGRPSKVNSHPHLDNTSTFAVVHNGIIENYSVIKKILESNGYTFFSETDTEVIPNLIQYFYKQNNNFLKAVSLASKKLEGSYAINVISKNEPDKIIAVKKDSPLIIGKGTNESFISSDIPAILSYTNDFYFLDDFEIAEISKESINFYDFDLNVITKKPKIINLDNKSAQKDGYEDFMLKEIFEQPKAVRRTIKDIEFDFSQIRNFDNIHIVGCGTAMHAGLVGKYLFEELCRIPTTVNIASEFRYNNPILSKKSLVIFISQSGETADTLAALKLAKSKSAKTIAISNVIESSIPRQADWVFYTKAGPEIAVASTKAYTSQISLLTKLCICFAKELGTYPANDLERLDFELASLPEKITDILDNTDKIKEIAKYISEDKDIYYIGRGIDYCVAQEASLKLKEISYIHSESYAAGELKHGTIALIENGINVISIISNPELASKTISNVQEVITRGAKAICITNQNIDKKIFECVVEIPEVHTILSPILSVIPLQLLAYYTAKEKKLDVDKPRNLAKSVTVE